jgi:phosphoglycerate dehydrogenase-like enzyme
MEKPKILFLPRTGLAEEILSERACAILEEVGEVVWNKTDRDPTPEELASLLPGAHVAVTSWGTPPFTPELLVEARDLQIVGHAAGSVKHLMPKEGYDRNIVVLSGAAVIADSVAEYTLWAMLSMQRNLYRYEGVMKQQRLWKHGAGGFGEELYYKRVGIVGASMVGRRVIQLLRPFSCEVMVYDPYLGDAEAKSLGVACVPLNTLFATSDIVSVHAPVTPETHRLIGAEHFRLMQAGALFINTARAWIVDQDAMVAVLRTGRLRAVLDVFEHEPLPEDDPLRDMQNVMLTPHVSGHTTESRLRLVEAISEDIRRFYAGEPLRLAVAWDRLKIMA